MTLTRTDAATTVAVPTRRRPSQTRRTAVRLIRRVPVWLIVALLMVVVLYPQLWMVLGSFKTQSEFLSNPAVVESFILRPDSLDIAASGVARGIIAYFNGD